MFSSLLSVVIIRVQDKPVGFVLVGALKNGYIHRVPLPKVPQEQSTSEHVASAAAVRRDSHATCYLQVPCFPTCWSDLIRSLAGFSR